MNNAAESRDVQRLLTSLFIIIFSSTLFIRAVDPVIPLIAHDLGVAPATAALLSTAFALPYALIQPVLGASADVFGKTRMMAACVVLMAITAVIGTLAQNFTVLIVARALSGIAAGGIFPVVLALVGDLVPVNKRQVTVARLLGAAMFGNLIGAAAAGAVGDLAGWRGVFAGMIVLSLLSVGAAVVGFRGQPGARGKRLAISDVGRSYRAILGHPLAKICFGAVFLEGMTLFGLFPYMALLLRQAGQGSASVAGIVLGGFGLGGIAYAFSVSWLLRSFGERKLMIGGAATAAMTLVVVALSSVWPLDAAALVAAGCGFYMLHGVIQIYASELAPEARGSAMALHSFSFFLGQAIGPLYYGFGFRHAGEGPTLIAAAVILLSTGLMCARWLRRPEP